MTISHQDKENSLQGVFADFQVHFSQNRPGTEVVLTQSIRRRYPEYHVTIVPQRGCDLLGFAAAGYADSVLTYDEEYYDGTRVYSRPPRRNEAGSLENTVRFGTFNYSYSETQFLLIEVSYESDCSVHNLYFILAPRSHGQITGAFHSKTDELILAAGSWTRLLHSEVYVFDNGSWQKDKELWKVVQDASWDDVILDIKMKQSLIDDVEGFFDSQPLYSEFRVPWKRGIILWGLPGNGKTASIKALMHALSSRTESIPALYVKSFDCRNGAQYSVRSIFTHARSVAPCLLIFEDLDSLVQEKVRSYFLNEVDGIESNDGILMVGSTNHLSKLDPAISQRPSRFDRKYHFDLPSLPNRVAYCKYWQKKMTQNKSIVFPDHLCNVFAELTADFSFAYMKELFIAALLVLARGGTGDEPEDIVPSIQVNGTEPESEPLTEKQQRKQKKKKKEVVVEKHPRFLPEVEVPADLRGNVLLKVFKQQATLLLSEMDSTGAEGRQSVKVPSALHANYVSD